MKITAKFIYRPVVAAVILLVAGFAFTSLAETEPPSETAVWSKNKADDLFCRGKYSEAYAAYDAAEKYPVKNDEFTASLLLQKGLCRFKEKRTSDAFSLWSRLRGLYPKTAAAPQSLLLEAEDPTNKGKLDRFYDEILTKYPQSDEAASVLQKRGQAAFDKKDYAKAAEYWAQFVSGFPNHKKFAEVKAKLESAKLAAGGDKSASGEAECASLLQRADALFDRAAYQQAVPLYQELLNKHALSKEAGKAVGRLAQSLQALGKDQEALLVLQRMVEKNAGGAPQALAEIVIQATNRKMEPLRIQATQQLMERYPDTIEAQQALFIAGSLAKERNNRAEAEKTWSLLLSKYPESPFRKAVERELSAVPIVDAKGADKRTSDSASKKAAEEAAVEQRKRWEQEAWEFELAYRNLETGPDERAEAAFEWAERILCLHQYEKAVQQYQRVWEEFPESGFADHAAFAAAQAWYCAEKPDKGNEQLLFVANRYPTSTFRPLALFCLGSRCVLYEGNLTKAWEFYDQLIKEYPQDPLTNDARKFWAEVSGLSKQELKEQVAHFLSKEKVATKKTL